MMEGTLEQSELGAGSMGLRGVLVGRGREGGRTLEHAVLWQRRGWRVAERQGLILSDSHATFLLVKPLVI
jgi:hypothetical protein